MMRWLERRGVWQYFIIAWAFVVLVSLAGTMTAAWLGLGPVGSGDLKRITFGSLIMATGATVGFQMRKARRRRDAKP